MKQNKTQTLAQCAILVSLSFVLSYVRLITMPMEGSVTLMSMLPVMLIGIRFGLKWGIASSFCYAVLQLIQSITVGGLFSWGLSPLSLIACIILDYLLPFTLLGITGLVKNKTLFKIMASIIGAVFLRFICHTVSGAVIFSIITKTVDIFSHSVTFTDSWLYSICYNGFYLAPELILTLIGAYLLIKIPAAKRLLLEL
ncbi:MAG: proton-coupled thiamine transporter YuaJ [Ruminococcaceae bacterium]|nr:proton-coupled thiamine transporter YuaJ [Oscillospiraceae bacterium]